MDFVFHVHKVPSDSKQGIPSERGPGAWNTRPRGGGAGRWGRHRRRLSIPDYAAWSSASWGSAAGTASAARFLPGTKSAATAPAPTIAEPTQIAGVSPST